MDGVHERTRTTRARDSSPNVEGRLGSLPLDSRLSRATGFEWSETTRAAKQKEHTPSEPLRSFFEEQRRLKDEAPPSLLARSL